MIIPPPSTVEMNGLHEDDIIPASPTIQVLLL